MADDDDDFDERELEQLDTRELSGEELRASLSMSVTVRDAMEIFDQVLASTNRVLIRRDVFVELLDALEDFGMKEHATDSKRLKRIKLAYHAVSRNRQIHGDTPDRSG